ncbi:Maintenance of telomere capping protein 6 [Talaromyces islandicus]|uniref:Maintenance of telomere capping protein 6 n=1 Tax=Talaromyces islandicus TaxID=28573 RepID=A0A0U1M0I6_TALIS|nr:Maintenance of telomere capping protein 6 [Talaromyces islandicus]
MSGTFTSEVSLLTDVFWVNLLSQRDVSSQVPINYITQPAIDLTAACFSDHSYDGAAGSLCLSELLVIGYRRFIIDVYWSHETQQWLLCPVSLPSSSTSGTSRYHLGIYTCSGSFNLRTITDVIHQYIQNSEENVATTFLYLIFNLHAATASDAPDEPPPNLSASSLPSETLLLGYRMSRELKGYLYTPTQLAHDRTNLNASWYADISDKTNPLASYFTTNTDSHGIQSTADGWPCAGYLEKRSNKRLLLGWGSIDDQMKNYDFDTDASFVFAADQVLSNISTTVTSDGKGLQSGCFYDNKTTQVPNVNASWAASIPANVDFSSSTDYSGLLVNFTSCGISLVIDQPLGDGPASTNIDPYRNLSMSNMWSWANGEPRNASDHPELENGSTFRCAVMDVNSQGHWRAGNCSDEHRAACRIDNQPYSWILSPNATSFSASTDGCPENSSFDVPRTGLENTYLYHSALSTVGDASDGLVWVNFNSIEVQYCWVYGGSNASCPYSPGANDVERRTILIPTIAAIVVLIITALTLFIKCNSNRRVSRKRKRVIEGWEYEGVPS